MVFEEAALATAIPLTGAALLITEKAAKGKYREKRNKRKKEIRV